MQFPEINSSTVAHKFRSSPDRFFIVGIPISDTQWVNDLGFQYSSLANFHEQAISKFSKQC